MRFSGDIDDRCPISFVDVRDIENPVGFDDAKHAFECRDLVEWLTHHSASNPMTREPLTGTVAEMVHPLIVDGDEAHLDETRRNLRRASLLTPRRWTIRC